MYDLKEIQYIYNYLVIYLQYINIHLYIYIHTYMYAHTDKTRTRARTCTFSPTMNTSNIIIKYVFFLNETVIFASFVDYIVHNYEKCNKIDKLYTNSH